METKSMVFCLAAAALAAGSAGAQPVAAGKSGAELSYYGRSSLKIRTASGFVIYVDPYAEGDYAEPADLVLVTHGHGDHNQVGLVSRKAGAVVVAPAGAAGGPGLAAIKEGETRSYGPVTVRALPAANKNHRRGSGFGYLVSFDGIVLYHAGDTSWLPEMAEFAAYGIGWALLPCDGFYNMGPEEAARCAAAMKAKRVLPIHSGADGLYDAKNAADLAARAKAAGAGAFVLEPGKKLTLVP